MFQARFALQVPMALAMGIIDCAWLLPGFCSKYHPESADACVRHNWLRVALLLVAAPLAVICMMESHFRRLFLLRHGYRW